MITAIKVLFVLVTFEDAVASKDIGGYSSHETSIVVISIYSYVNDIKFPRNYYFYHSGIDFGQMKRSSYCSGKRLGLGSDILHGIGVESLKKCAEYALSDSRCDGTGYFDAYRRGEAYQCKCPENGACLINAGSGPGWSIFRASYSGTYSLYLYQRPHRI